MSFRQRAIGALGVSLIRDIESSVESSAKIFPGNHTCQFDELLVTEMFAKRPDLFIGRGCRSGRERDCVVEDELFEWRKRIAGCVIREPTKLFFSDAFCSANGRIDIQSKQTPNHRRSLDAGQRLELLVDGLRAVKRHLEKAGPPHHSAALRHDPQRFRNFARLLARNSKYLADHKACLFVRDPVQPCHTDVPPFHFLWIDA